MQRLIAILRLTGVLRPIFAPEFIAILGLLRAAVVLFGRVSQAASLQCELNRQRGKGR